MVVRAPLEYPLTRDDIQTRSGIVRVNDRGPFPSQNNPDSGKRIIDLSRRAAEQLGFVEQGVVQVRVETIQLESGNGSWRNAHQRSDMRDASSQEIVAFVDGTSYRIKRTTRAMKLQSATDRRSPLTMPLTGPNGSSSSSSCRSSRAANNRLSSALLVGMSSASKVTCARARLATDCGCNFLLGI
ncbi:MAG: hypothetical protein H8K07_13845 [Nitrospira sp.]|nr:hypothetical protein [Nitrospira sp.]